MKISNYLNVRNNINKINFNKDNATSPINNDDIDRIKEMKQYAITTSGKNHKINAYNFFYFFENQKLLDEIVKLDFISKKGIILKINKAFFHNILSKVTSEEPVLIAICGESASGKTTLNNSIINHAKENNIDLTYVNTDNYFKDISEQIKEAGSFDEFLKTGYDLDSPDSFYVDELKENLIALKNGEVVKARKYKTDGTGVSKINALKYYPKKIIIVEGTISALDEIRDLFDAKIYVQTDDEVRKNRYIKRAVEQRNQDEKGALAQWEYICEAGKKYVQPLKDNCDVVVNGEFDDEYIGRLIEKLTHLHK